MSSDEAFETFRRYESTDCTVQFWLSGKPAQTFRSLRECVLFVADHAADEAMPDVHVHLADGEISFSGSELEGLIAAARATRASH